MSHPASVHQAIIVILVCAGLVLAGPAEGRRTMDILTIDLDVSPNPIPCGGSANVTVTIQTRAYGDLPARLSTLVTLYDYDTMFRDGDDELDKKAVIIDDIEGQTTLSLTLHCQIKDQGCDLYGPAGSSGESSTYVFARTENSDVESPKVYVQCKQIDVDAILSLQSDDDTVEPGESITAVQRAESPLPDVIEGDWRVAYNGADLTPQSVEWLHPVLSAHATHNMANPDAIDITLQLPAGESATLEGDLFSVTFAVNPTPTTAWDTTDIRVPADAVFTDVSGVQIDVCTGGSLTPFIAPTDDSPPLIDPAVLTLRPAEIIGGPGAVSDNLDGLTGYLSVDLYDETGTRVAQTFVDSDGQFRLDQTFVLAPDQTAYLLARNGVGLSAAHGFAPVPELADALAILILLAGSTPDRPLIGDVNGDSTTGTPEAVYLLERIAGVRSEPALDTLIEGRVIGADGVTVTLSGDVSGSAGTDAEGRYAFFGLAPGGSYTVTPQQTGLVFNPPVRSFGLLTDNVTNVDFTAAIATYTISGTVTGAEGVTVHLTGDAEAEAVTDATGSYAFEDLPHGGSYTVTPEKAGFGFDPPAVAFAPLTGDGSGADFTAVPANAPPSVEIMNILPTDAVLAGQEIELDILVTDPDGDDVYVKVDWGDGETTDYDQIYNSGDHILLPHIYQTPEIYHPKAMARDVQGLEGPWSPEFDVNVF